MPNKFRPITELRVSIKFVEQPISVGRLAFAKRQIHFEYDSAFLGRGLVLSRWGLPMQQGAQKFDPNLFEGLPGVFYDSLPDGWGRLLLDRTMQAHGVAHELLSPLDRLAHVGGQGMGALVYEPDLCQMAAVEALNLDAMSKDSQSVLRGDGKEVLDKILKALQQRCGSSAGARPKAVIGVNADRSEIVNWTVEMQEGFEPWLVKFRGYNDSDDVGAVEYAYSVMAREAGLQMAATHLFPAQQGPGYFATRRFDRSPQGGRLHMHSACGLLHSDFRVPALDYKDLLNLTSLLTRDSREVESMFRIAVFNVLTHNRDDHGKNFAFLMDAAGKWTLAPAYDLTFSAGPAGEHSTTVMGEGKSPGREHLNQLGEVAGLVEGKVREIIDQTAEAVGRWRSVAGESGVSDASIKQIGAKLEGLRSRLGIG